MINPLPGIPVRPKVDLTFFIYWLRYTSIYEGGVVVPFGTVILLLNTK